MENDAVNLSWTESFFCAQVGAMWELSAIFGERGDHAYEHPEVEWKAHIEGYAAEYAAAKFVGIFKEPFVVQPFEKFKRVADVGPFQVRGAARHDYRLTLRPGRDETKRNIPWILVTGIIPNFRVRGWLYGREVMVDENWEDPGNKGQFAWWAKVEDLRPMDTLRTVQIEGWEWEDDRWVKTG